MITGPTGAAEFCICAGSSSACTASIVADGVTLCSGIPVQQCSSDPIHQTQISIAGIVNGDSVRGNGVATYDLSTFPTNLVNDITFAKLPLAAGFPTWLPHVNMTVINTWKCTVIDTNKKNIATLTGGNYNITRDVTVKDDAGNTIGHTVVSGNVTTQDANHSLATLTISGSYSGPLDFTNVSGYAMRIHQQTPTQLIGDFVQTVSRTGGAPVTCQAHTVWDYVGGQQLTAAEQSNLTLGPISWDGTRIYFAGTGYYGPVAVASGLSVWGAVLLIGGLLGAGGLSLGWRHARPKLSLRAR